MSYPQFQAASDYLGAIADSDAMDYDMDRADGEHRLMQKRLRLKMEGLF